MFPNMSTKLLSGLHIPPACYWCISFNPCEGVPDCLGGGQIKQCVIYHDRVDIPIFLCICTQTAYEV